MLLASHKHKAGISYVSIVKILRGPVFYLFFLSCELLTNKSTVTFSVVCHRGIATCISFIVFKYRKMWNYYPLVKSIICLVAAVEITLPWILFMCDKSRSTHYVFSCSTLCHFHYNFL